jgi:hypothetical protein
MRDKEFILNEIGKALDWQFSNYSWWQMIDDTDLTKEEKEWAKEHISYKAYIFN